MEKITQTQEKHIHAILDYLNEDIEEVETMLFYDDVYFTEVDEHSIALTRYRDTTEKLEASFASMNCILFGYSDVEAVSFTSTNMFKDKLGNPFESDSVELFLHDILNREWLYNRVLDTLKSFHNSKNGKDMSFFINRLEELKPKNN